jgi:hypothetical protein
MQVHAAARPRYGYRRLHVLVEREGVHANRKRFYRVYRAAGLQVRRRSRKRLTRGERIPLVRPTAPLERWSMDFMRDTLADWRGYRTLNTVDDFNHECPAIEVDRSLPGARVVRVLERLAETIGLPKGPLARLATGARSARAPAASHTCRGPCRPSGAPSRAPDPGSRRYTHPRSTDPAAAPR